MIVIIQIISFIITNLTIISIVMLHTCIPRLSNKEFVFCHVNLLAFLALFLVGNFATLNAEVFPFHNVYIKPHIKFLATIATLQLDT